MPLTTSLANRSVLLFLMVFWGPMELLFAQSQITFRQLSVEEGLSQNSAISIAQDSTGYLWIATQDGLNKYDGRKFTVFPYRFVDITKPDYSHLGKVYKDREGGLWILPSDKIPKKWDPVTQTFDPLSQTDDASVLYQDASRNLWIGTYSEGLSVLRPDADEPVQILPFSQVGGTVYNIAQKKDGTLVLATDRRLVEFHPDTQNSKLVRLRTNQGLPVETNFSDIVFDGNNREWLGTFGEGLFFRDPNEEDYRRISELPLSDSLPQNLNILDLHIDAKDRLWVATYGRGLYLIEVKTAKITHFKAEKSNPKALHYNDVLCIYEDFYGTMWFGTDGAGASYYDEYLEKFNSLTNFETPENISIDVVRTLTVDNENTVWIGTSGKGLTRYEPSTDDWNTYTTDPSRGNTLPSDRIMSLYVDVDGELWIGTQGGGLAILDREGRFRTYSPNSENWLSANTFWCIYEDAIGQVWLGTREQGLIRFDKEKGEIEHYKKGAGPDGGIPSNNVRTLTEDDQGNLWIGTENAGIVYFDRAGGEFVPFRHRPETNSLSSDKIKSLYYAPDGILWIGTNGGGLNAFAIGDQEFRSFTVEDGLANNVIYSILPDRNGNLWLSSNKGISRFAPGETFKSPPEITNYTNYAGLATEFNTGASYKDNEGNLYFGGLDGFYWFKPSEIKENTLLPKTTITGLSVFDESRPLTDGLELEHDQNTVAFTFSSMQFSLPEKNRYRYKLRNYDEDWVEAGNTDFARYTQLPSGDYEFQVQSSNYDGVWNDTPVTHTFSIAPPWYATPYAKFMYLLLFLAALLWVYFYLKWRWRMQLDLRLKEDEARRLQQLHTMKSKLYTDISHEFRTPLTLISGPIDAKLAEGGLTDADVSNFSMIKRNTNRLIALVDQLLHLAKLEKGKGKLRFSEDDLGLFLGMIAKGFEYRASQKNMDYDIHIDPLGKTNYDGDALEKIVTNLLSNAFKYGQEGGMCRFEALGNEDGLQIRVTNTVEEATDIDIDKLFGRFYQEDEFSEGAGVGLSLVQELVRLYQGEISVRMDTDDSILFQVELPIEVGKPQTKDEPDDPLFKKSTEKEFPATLPGLETEADAVPSNQHSHDELSEAMPNAGGEVQSDPSNRPTPEKDRPLVLIVEDHEEVRQFLKSAWKDRYEVLEAQNGKKGVEKALKIVPDLIVSDVRMPVRDGIELCDTLKTDERTSHIPIILLTAGMGEEQEIRGLRSGADDFVTKPFKLPVLQTRVENLIKTRRALRDRYSQETVLQAKDIALTPTDEIFLDRVQKVLDEQLSDSDFNATAFSREVGMSRMQLHRKLQAYTGLSTTEFIRSQRLKQALHILKTADATVSEVAYTVGFNTPSYFIKCFKETYGKTPAEMLQTT